MWGGIPTPHGPCSYCFSSYHHVKDCPTGGQFSNYFYKHMNTQFSRPRNEPYCDSYDPAWSNQSNNSWQAQMLELLGEINQVVKSQGQAIAKLEDQEKVEDVVFSWQDQAPESYAPQFHELYHQTYSEFNDQAAYPPSNFHPPHQQWQSYSYCADFEDNWQHSSQATPPLRLDSDFQDQLLKFMSKMDANEEEPSPIDWSPQQQYHAEPPSTQSGSDFQAQMLELIGEINQIVKSQGQAIAKLELQMEQMAKQVEEEELQRQSEADLDGHYVVDESTYHEQAITTMNNGEVVETHVEEGKDEQIEAPQALHRAKGEEVSTEVPSLSTLILETPYEPRAPIACDLPRGQESSLLGILEEQKETIKVENFLVYSPHSISVHDSLPDENTQRDLPRYVGIRNYLYVGKLYSLWSKRRKDWCFKFKLKGQRTLSASRMWIPLAWRIPLILTK
jgi:hypothetical protein